MRSPDREAKVLKVLKFLKDSMGQISHVFEEAVEAAHRFTSALEEAEAAVKKLLASERWKKINWSESDDGMPSEIYQDFVKRRILRQVDKMARMEEGEEEEEADE